jgi:hypothetical protein
MGKSRVVFAALAMVLFFGTFAHAGIVYNNGGPNQQNGNEATEWVQTEDFMLTSATTVTGVEFWDIESPPGYSGSITWWITGDTGGNPDFSNILGTGNVALTTHTLTANGCTVLGFLCEYDDTFGLSVALQAGVEYHLALHNGPVTNTTRSEFYWETTNPNSTQTGLECDLTLGACFNSWNNNGDEHAFNLTGGTTNTPEPGTLALFGTSVVGLAGMLRRKLNR